MMVFLKYVVFVVAAIVSCCYSQDESLALSYNGTATKWWRATHLDNELRIHLFNYTNIEEYLKGQAKKLIVEDLGPYVYVEKVERVNVTFNTNYTISYREKRSHIFNPEKSNGRESDNITMPNLPLLIASSVLRHMSQLNQLFVNALLPGSKAFKTLTVRDLIWGYEDPVMELANRLGYGYSKVVEKFRLLENGSISDFITIFTGEDDIRKRSLIDRYNGLSKMDFWSTDECNQLDGTDGLQFPPHWMDKKQPLQLFMKAFSTKLPLVYEKKVNVLNGIPAWRYKLPLNVFAHPDNNTVNSCYCDTRTNNCPPSGLFNASLCFDAPMFLSCPHFFTGDPKLFENIEGLKPDETKHESYVDVHPELAFTIEGASRFQINVQVQKAYWFTALSQLSEGQYLPVLWVEAASGKLTDEIRDAIYRSTFIAIPPSAVNDMSPSHLTELTTLRKHFDKMKAAVLHEFDQYEARLNAMEGIFSRNNCLVSSTNHAENNAVNIEEKVIGLPDHN